MPQIHDPNIQFVSARNTADYFNQVHAYSTSYWQRR
jgi:hypothetical protein